MKLKISSLMILSLMSLSTAAKPLPCIVKKQYSLGWTHFEQGEVHERTPTIGKGMVDTMFTVDLDAGSINGVVLNRHTYKNDRNETIHQLYNKKIPDSSLSLITFKKSKHETGVFVFNWAKELIVLTGECHNN